MDAPRFRHPFCPVYRILVSPCAGTQTKQPPDTSSGCLALRPCPHMQTAQGALHPGKLLEMEFNEKMRQTVLIRLRRRQTSACSCEIGSFHTLLSLYSHTWSSPKHPRFSDLGPLNSPEQVLRGTEMLFPAPHSKPRTPGQCHQSVGQLREPPHSLLVLVVPRGAGAGACVLLHASEVGTFTVCWLL